MKRDLMNSIHPIAAVQPQIVGDGSSILSAAIDVRGYKSVTFIIVLGNVADSDATWTVAVQEGSTSTQADHTAVADKDLVGTEALASFQFDNDGECRKIGYVGDQDYVSLEIDNGTANSANLFISVVMIAEPYEGFATNPPV